MRSITVRTKAKPSSISNSSKRIENPRRNDWLRMSIDGDYILSWAMTSPNDLQAEMLTGQFSDEGLIQANAIIECLQNILPPKPQPKDWRFLIQLGENMSFLNFRIVPKNVTATRVGEYRSQTLSLVPKDWYSGWESYCRLIKRFHTEFFGRKPSIREMEEFILDGRNFGVSYQDALIHSTYQGPRRPLA